MKKNIFSTLILALYAALFFVLFTACADESSSGDKEDYAVDVLYSDDWRYISIYLEGKDAPISVNYSVNKRAMTPDTARRGFDYFEVFFYYNGVIRRSAWELGKKASVMDVHRTTSGIDYSMTSVASAAGSNNGVSSGGGSSVGMVTGGSAGSAVLFAGRKTDKTLLAVGKLVSVDADEPVENPQDRSTYINNGTVFVTFELSALTGNTSADMETKKSSFLFDYTGGNNPAAENTKVINALIGEKYFPLYVLPGGKSKINARYYFGIDGDWSDFEGCIFLMDKGKVDKRQARYPAGSGKYWYAKYTEDQTTVVKMTNNQSSWEPPSNASDGNPAELQNPLTFEIDTSKTVNAVKKDNGIFTFSFEIPVYAISPLIPKNESDCWYIRPAYMSYYYNIDNGNTTGEFSDKNIGGGVLCGVDFELTEIPAERR